MLCGKLLLESMDVRGDCDFNYFFKMLLSIFFWPSSKQKISSFGPYLSISMFLLKVLAMLTKM